MNLAGVAFGHDWLAGAGRYHGTLEHLASWGIVAAAPDTETGLAPSVLNLAFDLGTTLDIIAGVRLGTGKISVHPTKLGVVGHGFGGSAAVFTAAGMPDRLKAAAALFPTVTHPPAEQPAAGLRVPGMILTTQTEGPTSGRTPRTCRRHGGPPRCARSPRSSPAGWPRDSGWRAWSGCPAPTAAPRRWSAGC